jgi:alkanesulfonate monooxygenase SsuD/methylene tetrahydromethanopterin reductase-like flavin-dependent oxidoreductase (luciferase family)
MKITYIGAGSTTMISIANTNEEVKNKANMCINKSGLSEVVLKRDPRFESVIYGIPRRCVEKIEQYVQAGVEQFVLVFPFFPQVYELKL